MLFDDVLEMTSLKDYDYRKIKDYKDIESTFYNRFENFLNNLTTNIILCLDRDTDGVVCTKEMMYLLKERLGKENVELYYGDSNSHGNNNVIKLCKENSSVIILDSSINNINLMQTLDSMRIPTLIVDHHQFSRNIFEIDKLMYITALNTTWELDTRFHKLSCGYYVFLLIQQYCRINKLEPIDSYKDLAVLSLVSDVCDMSHQYNRSIMKSFVEAMEHYRFLSEFSKHGDYTWSFLAFDISPKINIVCKLNSTKHMHSLILEDDLETNITEMKNLHKANKKLLKNIINMISVEKLENIVYADITDYVEKCDHVVNYTGVLASTLSERFCKPCVVYVRLDGIIKGSARSNHQCNLFSRFEYIKTLFLEYGGHPPACGFRCDADNIHEILDKLNISYSVPENRSSIEVENLNSIKDYPLLQIVMQNEYRGACMRPISFRYTIKDTDIITSNDNYACIELPMKIINFDNNINIGDCIDIIPTHSSRGISYISNKIGVG